MYNKVEAGLWGSESYRALSRMECSGQALWLYILTCPQRHSSGIFRCGIGTIADHTLWHTDAIANAIDNAIANGFVFYDSGIIVIANSYKYNKPDTKKHCINWANHIAGLPSCKLKDAYIQYLSGLSSALANAIAYAIDNATTNGFAYDNACPKAITKAKTITIVKGSDKKVIYEMQCKDGIKQITEDKIAEWIAVYGEAKTTSALTKMQQYLIDVPAKQPTTRGFSRFCHNWLGNHRMAAEPAKDNQAVGSSFGDTREL